VLGTGCHERRVAVVERPERVVRGGRDVPAERELEHAESYMDQVDDELAKLPRQGSGRHRLNR
jgi:hypothetical protein